ncbi:bifunctional 4-hydroxy-2-oxoglutarate aldolase/2-dehydro-3-deoxy-phosphogluconate aldolase [Caenispirillum salinarum]
MPDAMLDILKRAPVVPVLVIENADDAVPLARALVAGGLPALEVTLRTPAALDSIRRITAEVPEALVGVGTIMKPADFDTAQEAGARFAVSPGATDALLEAARASGMPFLPGVATASEVMRGMEAGLSVFKAFPAAAIGGPATVAAFGGPFPEARFCPTGGIRSGTAADYLRLPNVVAIGGTWLAPKEKVRAGDWQGIEDLARSAAGLAEHLG